MQEKLAELACYREGINAHLTAAIAQAEPSPGGLLMPNQSLLYTGRVLACSQLPAMMHIARELCGGQICVTPDAAASFANPETGPWLEKFYTINEQWMAEDRRKLLAFARDLLNSDYAGHRLTFQLFAQSPPFAHLLAVYRNFDFDGPLDSSASRRPDLVRPTPVPCCTGSPREGCGGHERMHMRIRPFNTRDTYPEQKLDNDLCQAVVAGNTVYLRGQVGQDLDTAESVGVGDVAAQAEQAMANIELLLEEAGSELEDICQDRRLPDRIRLPRAGLSGDRALAEGRVPRSRPGSSSRPSRRPEWLVEIDVTAVIPPIGRRRRDLLAGSASTLPATHRHVRRRRLLLEPGGGRPLRCVRAGVGAACTQNITDPRLGPRLLDLMRDGANAQQAMATLVATDRSDRVPAADGRRRRRRHGGLLRRRRPSGSHRTVGAPDAVAAGNLLATPDVPAAMVEAWSAQPDAHLGDRLLAALAAGLAAGGEEGPVHSAGLLVADEVPWPVTDLRVDWADDPIGELTVLWRAVGAAVRQLRAARARSVGGAGVRGSGRRVASVTRMG